MNQCQVKFMSCLFQIFHWIYISEETELFPSLSHLFDSLLELKIVIYDWTRIPNEYDNFPKLKKLQIFGGKI